MIDGGGKGMRRKDREETSPAFFSEVFAGAEELFLAMNDDVFPYGIILNFVRDGDFIYIHSAKEGKKIALLRANPNVFFCLACGVKIDRPNSSVYYKSVFGTGLARIVDDCREKCHALDLLALRYQAHCQVPADEKSASRVAIIKIEIKNMTGKARKIG